jgi:GT2 family glycosyltransferase
MNISIIIVAWNSQDHIRVCLDSIIRPESPVGCEILVIDNASSDNTLQIVKRSHAQVGLIINQQNLGYAKANNQGIKKSTGRYVLLLNPDTEIHKGALNSMLDFMQAHPDVGALGPQLVNPDGSIQSSCREFPGFSTLLWEFSGLSRLFPKSKIFGSWRMGYFGFDRTREVDQPMGSCLMLRRETLDQVGLFDETFPMFFNDVDLCYRIKATGWRIFFYSDAQVMHHKGASTGKAKRKMIWLSHLAFYRFFRKHKTGPANRLLLLLLLIPLVLSALVRMMVKKRTIPADKSKAKT